jgi:hypothetical protein
LYGFLYGLLGSGAFSYRRLVEHAQFDLVYAHIYCEHKNKHRVAGGLYTPAFMALGLLLKAESRMLKAESQQTHFNLWLICI